MQKNGIFMPAQIEEIIKSHRYFLEKRKKELQDDNVQDRETKKDYQTQQLQGNHIKDSNIIEKELGTIDSQLLFLDELLDELSKSSLFVSDPNIFYTHSNSRLSHEIEKFRNNLLLVSHNKIAHFTIITHTPSIWDILDYMRQNLALRTLHIDTTVDSRFLNSLFIEDEEFANAFNSAPNLFYIYATINEQISKQKIIEMFSKRLAKEKSMVLCFIVKQIEQVEHILFKKPDSNEIDFYLPYYDEELKQITEENFLTRLGSKETFSFKLILKGIFSNIIKRKEKPYKGKCIIKDITIDDTQIFDGWYLIHFAVWHNDILTVQYLVTNGVNLSTLNSDGDSPLVLAAQYANPNILCALLEIYHPIPLANMELSIEKKARLETANRAGNTPLLVAVIHRKIKNVEFLLKIGSIVSHRNNYGNMAIDIAFEQKDWQCALALLRAGSPFPSRFDLSIIPSIDDLSTFIKSRQDYSYAIETGDVKSVLEAIDKGKMIPSFKNINNYSAPRIAFLNSQYEIYALLRSRGFGTFENEALGINLLTEFEKNKLKLAMIKFINKPNFSTVTYLLSRSRILQADPRHFEFIKQIYTDLTAIPEIQIILETLEYSSIILDIIFDFDQDGVLEISPIDGDSFGVCNHREGRIFIGAKRERIELLGTIAHEFTHQAMQIVFENNCNPYSCDNSVDLKSLNEIIDEIEHTPNLDPIINRVFTGYAYNKLLYPSEIIVRVPHILAKYNLIRGEAILQEQAKKLLGFYRIEVQRHCRDFILKTKNSSSAQFSPETLMSLKDREPKGPLTFMRTRQSEIFGQKWVNEDKHQNQLSHLKKYGYGPGVMDIP